ncbi:amino acid adenylation domain-containing protein [Streptomyces sp. LX-29]|uniref:amino acid adenylation domain-containing protein n=1 Tax=Streptomyces sp. LX-29 TaxID=2900152 RepID=UPI00240DF36C|nr:amino acid adenylation domain-containing protein [Streptomyces sp. LX-29]
MPTPDQSAASAKTPGTTEPAARQPLLAAMEGLWSGQQLDLDSPAYNTAEYVLIHGPVDIALFEQAIRQAVAESEALNIRFVVEDGRPSYLATPVTDWAVHHADLTDRSDAHAAAREWMAADMARPVDLERDPLFGHALFRTGAEEYLWYHRVHHIALDGFGLSLVARRVAEVYTALAAGEPVGDSGFGTLASVREEELAYQNSPRFAKDRAYWTERYADRPEVVSLSDRSGLPAREFLRRVTDLDPEATEALRARARELSAPWSELLLATTVGYLHHVTGAPEVVLSLPVMGRLGSVALRVPACVRNVLPLRVAVGPQDTLGDLVARVSAELRAGLPHQRYRYEHIRRDLKLVGGQRRLSGPGVNIMPFEYDLRFAGHRSTVHNVSAGPVDDLSVNVYDRADGALRIAFDANPDLYDEAELARHQEGLLTLLRALLADPGRELGAAEAPVAVTGRVLATLDGGPLPRPARSVLDRITEHAVRRGDAIALEHGDRRVSYAQLLGEAQHLAGRLAAREIGPGSLVALALSRGVDTVTAILGVLLSGAAYWPVDPATPATRLAALLDDAGAALVLTDEAHAAGLRATAPVPLLLVDDAGATTASEAPVRPAPLAQPAPEQLAYVIYTSGSTGQPKGVEISHGALAHFTAAAGLRYGPQTRDRVLQFAPPQFDASVEEIFLTLCTGATLVIRTEEMTESIPGFLAACERLRISMLDLPTAYWHELAYAVSTGAATLPEAVHTVIIGGEAALPERVDRWRESVGTSVRLFNTYGPTEATVVATAAELQDPALSAGDVPIGTPLPGLRAVLTEAADATDDDSGTVGELHLVGDALALGYRGARQPDNARFAPLDGLPDRPRAYRTGDLVRIGDDGLLRFVGRVDGEFKISGHRVHPAEVESILLGHAGVREAAVVGQILPDGGRRLVAYIVPADGAEPTAEPIREHLRAALPAAVVPSAIEFTDRLPRTGTGKIDRRALAEPRSAAPQDTADSTPAAAAASPLERTIMGVWAQILGAEDITPSDDVFDLGAQSLQAIQVANRLGVELDREVKVAWLFQHPTAAELAGFLEPAGEERTSEGGLPAAVLADAVLDEDIRPGTAPRAGGAPRRILLTGATGFVGSHLLAELLATTEAEIVCPVRASSPDEAAERVRRALADQQLPLPVDRDRITAEPADLARPHLGLTPERFAELTESVDAIYHNAATVSIMRDYASLRGANTESTRWLLRMAAARSVPLHLVSTLSTTPPLRHAPEVTEEFFGPHPGLIYGYQQSKWASERLLEQAAERGLPVTLHRLGRIVGPAGTGYVNERDFLWSVLRAGIPAGIVPELFEAEVWTPVDFVARAVVRLSSAADGSGEVVFNHAPVEPVRLADLYGWVREYGYPVRSMPLARWRAELPRVADVAATTLAFFDSSDDAQSESGESEELDLRLGRVRADHVLRGLAGTGVSCPEIDRTLVFRYLDHCVKAGTLPQPPADGGEDEKS